MSPTDYMRSRFFRDQCWFDVANASGEVIPPFSVVYNYSPAVGNNNFGFFVAKPNAAATDFYRDYFVTGPYSIAAASGAEGVACSLSSIGFVRTNGSPTAGAVWGPKHGQFSLEENYYGFLMQSTSTTVAGVTVSLAKQIGIHSICGKIDDATVNKNSAATVSIWDSARAGDTLMNVSAYNRSINLTSVSGKMCIVIAPGTLGELVLVECG